MSNMNFSQRLCSWQTTMEKSRHRNEVTLFVFAITRDIFILMKKPDLRKKWIEKIVEYIHEHYGNPPNDVDAIVDPITRGFEGYVSPVMVATKLRLPYIPIHKAGESPVHADDVIQADYTNRRNEAGYFKLSFLYFFKKNCQLLHKVFVNNITVFVTSKEIK